VFLGALLLQGLFTGRPGNTIDTFGVACQMYRGIARVVEPKGSYRVTMLENRTGPIVSHGLSDSTGNGLHPSVVVVQRLVQFTALLLREGQAVVSQVVVRIYFDSTAKCLNRIIPLRIQLKRYPER